MCWLTIVQRSGHSVVLNDVSYVREYSWLVDTSAWFEFRFIYITFFYNSTTSKTQQLQKTCAILRLKFSCIFFVRRELKFKIKMFIHSHRTQQFSDSIWWSCGLIPQNKFWKYSKIKLDINVNNICMIRISAAIWSFEKKTRKRSQHFLISFFPSYLRRNALLKRKIQTNI